MAKKVRMLKDTYRREDRAREEGYDDGLQEGERRGWEMGKEAAAELMEANVVSHSTDKLPELAPIKLRIKPADNLEGCVRAAAIRKLKKP